MKNSLSVPKKWCGTKFPFLWLNNHNEGVKYCCMDNIYMIFDAFWMLNPNIAWKIPYGNYHLKNCDFFCDVSNLFLGWKYLFVTKNETFILKHFASVFWCRLQIEKIPIISWVIIINDEKCFLSSISNELQFYKDAEHFIKPYL